MSVAERISVVVPIYKAEAYLRQCVTSLTTSYYSDLEIILVDDGSPDGCPAICDALAAEDSRIRVLHKPNGGSVSARKAGLALATGEYVTFIDSDDWVAPDFIENAARILEKYHPDVLSISDFYIAEGETAERFRTGSGEFSGYYDRARLLAEVYGSLYRYRGACLVSASSNALWSKLIRRSLLERFMPGEPEEIRMGDDLAVTLPCILNAESVYFSDLCGYYYRMSEASITHSYDPLAPMRLNTLLSTLWPYGADLADCGVPDQLGLLATSELRTALESMILGCDELQVGLASFAVLWENEAVWRGLATRLPLKVRLLLTAARKNHLLYLRLLRRRWRRKATARK